MSNFTRWDLMKITAIKNFEANVNQKSYCWLPWSPSWPNLRCPPTLSYEPTQFHSLGSLAPFHSIGGATRFISSAQLSPSKQGLWYYILIFFNQTISCCSILASFGRGEIADSAQTEYCSTFHCSSVRVSQAWHLTFLTYTRLSKLCGFWKRR